MRRSLDVLPILIRSTEEGYRSMPEEHRLRREWRGNATHLPLWEKGVRYEDEYNRVLNEAIERGKLRQQAPDKVDER